MSDTATDPPRRRLFDQVAGAPTLIGTGSSVEGRLKVRGPMALAGTVIGDGEIDGVLSIALDGHWHGNVHAKSATIVGRITGDIDVAGKLEIGKNAVIRGRVRARVVAIADGALVDGDIVVTGDQPIVRFEEKRASQLG